MDWCRRIEGSMPAPKPEERSSGIRMFAGTTRVCVVGSFGSFPIAGGAASSLASY